MWFGLAGRADEGSSSSSDSESVGRSPTCAGPFLRFARAAAFFAFAAARRASRVTSSDALVGWAPAPAPAAGAASSLSSELSSSDEDSSLDEGISSPGSCCIRMACQFFLVHCVFACAREVAGGERGGELVSIPIPLGFQRTRQRPTGLPSLSMGCRSRLNFLPPKFQANMVSSESEKSGVLVHAIVPPREGFENFPPRPRGAMMKKS